MNSCQNLPRLEAGALTARRVRVASLRDLRELFVSVWVRDQKNYSYHWVDVVTHPGGSRF